MTTSLSRLSGQRLRSISKSLTSIAGSVRFIGDIYDLLDINDSGWSDPTTLYHARLVNGSNDHLEEITKELKLYTDYLIAELNTD